MTREEAIKELQAGYLGDTEEIVQAKHMGIKALEKQIAKKPIYKPANAIYQRPYCPLCNRELYAWNFQSGHCNCGQTIDCWENEGL